MTYIYMGTNPITLPCSLARAGKNGHGQQDNSFLYQAISMEHEDFASSWKVNSIFFSVEILDGAEALLMFHI